MLRHLHLRYLLGSAILVGLLTATASARDAKKPSEADVRREQHQKKLTKILQAESLGVTTNRAEQLKALIDSGTDLDQAYWQAGYVKYYDKWVPLGEPLFSTAEKEQREQYVNYRKQFWGNDEENLKIARWCAEFNLADQARAHIMAVLLKHPDNAELRSILGYKRIDGRWMNKTEYNSQLQAVERYVENLKKWIPVATSLRSGLTGGSKSARADALNRLTKINAIDARPALELVLMPVSPRLRQDYIDWLIANNHRESSLALCRLAMSAESKSTKGRIIKELRKRPMDDYIPVLMRGMRPPVEIDLGEWHTSEHMLKMSKYLEYTKKISRQLKLKRETFDSEQTFYVNFVIESYHSHMGLRTALLTPTLNEPQRAYLTKLANKYPPMGVYGIHPSDAHTLGGQLQREQLERNTFDTLRRANQTLSTIEERNIEYESTNEHIAQFLSQLLGMKDLATPHDWWNWWAKQLELDVIPKTASVNEVDEDIGISYRVVSCFIKGTPVYSEIGPVPIEILRVGDRVLAQNVDTGELTYKPVIRTTVRRPRPLVKISLGIETITATRGHPFWVAGTGWVKARDLKPGQMLHTATGAVKVDSVVEAPEQETYNLIVDGFHTYFVGDEKVLVHDVSLTTPTDAVVPGLIER